jgi:5'-nucleotidase
MQSKRGCVFLVFFMVLVLVVRAGTPLVILHTNDSHSQLEPIGSEDLKNKGKGGILRREALIRSVRTTEPNVLVLDAGDFVQGTSYFNFFKGAAEIDLMNMLKLDAVTLGNHEFDNGVEALSKMLKKARFEVICTCYDVSGTDLNDLVHPWRVVSKGSLRIGIVSANISPKGLIADKNFKGIRYLDPIRTADSTAVWLKDVKRCDLVVCISHLGFNREGSIPDDQKLAALSRGIDVIVGGHTHTLFKEPVFIKNQTGDSVLVNQCGKGGIVVGRLDLEVIQSAWKKPVTSK